MSTTLERTLYDSLAKYLMDKGIPNVLNVTGFYESGYSSGGCSCCGSDIEFEVDVRYTTITGEAKVYTFYGKFDDLWYELNRGK